MSWNALATPLSLPSRVHACTLAEIVKYAAGSGDFNPLHFDGGGGERLVPGRLKQAWLGRMVTEWLAGRGFVRRLACRYIGADPVGMPLTIKGEARRREVVGSCHFLHVRLWCENTVGAITTVGSALVEWTTID
jgi:acyl dehydratase